MKYSFILVLLFFIPSLLIGQNNDTEIWVGNAIIKFELKQGVTKSPDKYIHKIRVRAADDGIISGIELLSNSSLINPIAIIITRSGNDIIVTSSYLSQITKNTIRRSKDSVQIFGPLLTRKSPDFINVLIAPKKDVLFESPEILLSNKNGDLIETFKKIPSEYSALQYSKNVLLVKYKKEGNVDYKYIFRTLNGITKIDYYYPMGDDFNQYSPPIEIHGTKLYSKDTLTNVVNYYILKASSISILPEVLFTNIFLQNRN